MVDQHPMVNERFDRTDERNLISFLNETVCFLSLRCEVACSDSCVSNAAGWLERKIDKKHILGMWVIIRAVLGWMTGVFAKHLRGIECIMARGHFSTFIQTVYHWRLFSLIPVWDIRVPRLDQISKLFDARTGLCNVGLHQCCFDVAHEPMRHCLLTN